MRKIIQITIMLFLCIKLFASGTNNPNDVIYNDIDYWRNIGLIEQLPPIRPYPSQYIITLLETVIKKGDYVDVNKATKYLEYYTKTNLQFSLKNNTFSNLSENEIISGFGAEANMQLHEYLSAGLDINMFFLNYVDTETTAPNRGTGIDLNEDNMEINALGETWSILQSLNLNSALGTDKLWFQSGMMPSSFGPLFSDSVVVNPSAKQAAHFSTTWIQDNFTASYLFLSLVATDNTGLYETDDKFLHVRSLDFKFFDFWEFQFYESAIYGGKGIKPIFFLPFNEFFYSAGQSGTWDVNSLMGLSSRFQLPQNISLKGTVYIDDLNAGEMVKLNFDTKMKLAAQFELDWTPKKSIFNYVGLNYTAITPFMYTHITETPEDSEYFGLLDTEYDIRSYALQKYTNYENYTNGGLTIGPYGMAPNSDKIGLNIHFNGPKGFKIKLNSEVQRHGNASTIIVGSYELDSIITPVASTDPGYNDYNTEVDLFYDTYDVDRDGVFDDAIPTDGSIFDPGYNWTGGYGYQDSFPFLTQDILEIMIANEIVIITPEINFLNGSLSGELGYAYVYIKNYNLIEGNNTKDSYLRFSVNYNF